MNVAAVMELVTLIAFVVILAGGKQKRERGWRVLGFLLAIVAVLQCAGMAIVVSALESQAGLASAKIRSKRVNFLGISFRQRHGTFLRRLGTG